MYAQNSTLLIRHAQASYGASDYDQLSSLGMEQARRLGRHLNEHQREFECIYLGELKRHHQTLDQLINCGLSAPQQLVSASLNEYNSDSLLLAYEEETKKRVAASEHFIALRSALRLWMSGQIFPDKMPSYEVFRSDLLNFLTHIRSNHTGPVLVISSGGPISTMVASLFEANADATISLNYRIRNASITELCHDSKRHQLVGFNHIEHLCKQADASLITYI